MDEISVKWLRVRDPLNPLCGCDVVLHEMPDGAYREVTALRRLDVLLGDRPYQLRAPEGCTLGISIDVNHLEPSPVQDEIVEIGYDTPYGKFLEERSDGGADEYLMQVTYENAIQFALLAQDDDELLGNCTFLGVGRTERAEKVRQSFLDSDGRDEVLTMMKQEGY